MAIHHASDGLAQKKKELWYMAPLVLVAVVALVVPICSGPASSFPYDPLGFFFARPTSLETRVRELEVVQELQAHVESMRKDAQTVKGKSSQELLGLAFEIEKVMQAGMADPDSSNSIKVLQKAVLLAKNYMNVEDDHFIYNNVVRLGHGNFSKYIQKHGRVIVEFYAPWCHHCKKFGPQFEALAKKYKGRAKFAAVDAVTEDQIVKIFNVSKYPTLKWFVEGRVVDVKCLPLPKKVDEWIEEHLQPSYADVDQASDVVEALAQTQTSSDHIMKVVFGEGEKNSPIYKAFLVASELLRGKFVFTWALGTQGESIRLYRTGQLPVACEESLSCEDSHRDTCVMSKTACENASTLIDWLGRYANVT